MIHLVVFILVIAAEKHLPPNSISKDISICIAFLQKMQEFLYKALHLLVSPHEKVERKGKPK